MQQQPTQPHEPDALMTPNEVAALFRVHPRTVIRWVNAGQLPCVRTWGGHHRFRADVIYAQLAILDPAATQGAMR